MFIVETPKKGDKIYVEFAKTGFEGQATISKVMVSPTLSKEHYNYIFVQVEEIPNHDLNFKTLVEREDEWIEEQMSKRK